MMRDTRVSRPITMAQRSRVLKSDLLYFPISYFGVRLARLVPFFRTFLGAAADTAPQSSVCARLLCFVLANSLIEFRLCISFSPRTADQCRQKLALIKIVYCFTVLVVFLVLKPSVLQ